jgi:hypothetical protein
MSRDGVSWGRVSRDGVSRDGVSRDGVSTDGGPGTPASWNTGGQVARGTQL